MMDILSRDTIELLRDEKVRKTVSEVAKGVDSDLSKRVTVETGETGEEAKPRKVVIVRRRSA
jgi:hypothetical protein